MEKTELIKEASSKSGVNEEEVGKILDSFTDSIKQGLVRGEKVTIAGFGTFSLSKRKAQTFLNPKTKQVHDIPERVLPHFKAGKDLQANIAKS